MVLGQRYKVLVSDRCQTPCTRLCRQARNWKSVHCDSAHSTSHSTAGREKLTCAYGTTFTRPLLSSSYLKDSGSGLFVAFEKELISILSPSHPRTYRSSFARCLQKPFPSPLESTAARFEGASFKPP